MRIFTYDSSTSYITLCNEFDILYDYLHFFNGILIYCFLFCILAYVIYVLYLYYIRILLYSVLYTFFVSLTPDVVVSCGYEWITGSAKLCSTV